MGVGTFAEFMGQLPDEEIPVLRRLLADDMLNPYSTALRRYGEYGQVYFELPPGPLHWSRQVEWPWVLRHGDFDRPHQVLEVSGGHTVLKFEIARRCREVVDTEFEDHMVPVVKDLVRLMGAGNVSVRWADVTALPFPDGSFDRVVCVSTLEHMPGDWGKGVRELVRVLRPGGVLLLTLDVRLEGPTVNNFYVDLGNVGEVVGPLGITQAVNGMTAFGVLPDGTRLTVLMVRYAKPAPPPAVAMTITL